jgi:hypothetical protein
VTLSHITKVYAVTDAKIYPMTADAAGTATTYGPSIDVPGIKSVKITGSIDSKTLRGDNQLLDAGAILKSIDVQVANAKLSLDALAAIIGSAVADSGTTPNQLSTWDLAANPSFPYFRLDAVSAKADPILGNVLIQLPKLILTDFPDLGLAEEDYQETGFKATGLMPVGTGFVRMLRVAINETAAVLT